ncbi:MAG: VOC family protein [Rhodospirillaceae bacterium]|nr:VOC family protein [Rhodospirillaceae bacterium]MDD9915636.1 VOC family protein [Rhodospirillaceae bacterium]MDD9925262.1 VOC family protein [Rhodospirillaceae bacterium]
MSDTAATEGVHHVGLTVPDLAKTAAFFTQTLGYDQVGERPDYPAIFVSDGTVMITLWQASDPANAVAFDRKNVIGLHHMALKVASQDALDTLHDKLKNTDGVEIEFAPEPLRDGPVRHMMTAIPGGVRIEFIAV